MKKVLIVSLCILMLFTCVACTPNGFMSKSQTKKVYNEFGRPQAKMTINYKIGNDEVKVEAVYDLLLDKTPITVINFINLVNDGFYNDSISDKYNSTYHYLTIGKYTYEKESADSDAYRYYYNKSGKTFVGEFASNKYPEPKLNEGGYSEFSLFSLAMYYENIGDSSKSADYFNSANGTLILATADKDKLLNSENCAVFAKLNSVSVSYNGKDPINYGDKAPATIISHLTSFTSTTSRTVYNKDNTIGDSISIMSTRVMFNIEMLGDKDWSKLPKVG